MPDATPVFNRFHIEWHRAACTPLGLSSRTGDRVTIALQGMGTCCRQIVTEECAKIVFTRTTEGCIWLLCRMIHPFAFSNPSGFMLCAELAACVRRRLQAAGGSAVVHPFKSIKTRNKAGDRTVLKALVLNDLVLKAFS